jgi:hypothetical protein
MNSTAVQSVTSKVNIIGLATEIERAFDHFPLSYSHFQPSQEPQIDKVLSGQTSHEYVLYIPTNGRAEHGDHGWLTIKVDILPGFEPDITATFGLLIDRNVPKQYKRHGLTNKTLTYDGVNLQAEGTALVKELLLRIRMTNGDAEEEIRLPSRSFA